MKISAGFDRLSVISLVLFLSACATPPVFNIGSGSTPQGAHSQTKVIISDKRPESDKSNSIGSFFVGSADYGILTLGDESFSPNTLEALRLSVLQSASALKDRAPQQIDIKIERMIIQENRKQLFLEQGSRGFLLAEVIGEKLSGVVIDYAKRDPFFIATFQGTTTIDGTTRNISISKESIPYEANVNSAREKTIKATLGVFLQVISAQIIGIPNTAQRSIGVRADSPSHLSVASAQSGNTVIQQKPAKDKSSEQKFGKYSYQIEQKAKTIGCRGGSGAYLTTEAGPIESYRIDCEGGATYLARCEYGNCTTQ